MRKLFLVSIFLVACSDPDNDGQSWVVEEDVEIDSSVPDMSDEEEPHIGTQPNGSPCETGAECLGGICLTEGYPDGRCTSSCDGCHEDEACVGDVCVSTCINDDACPLGLACTAVAGSRICAVPTGANDGSACTSATDCQGGTCLTEWPDGYCTTVNCSTFDDCSRLGDNNRCLQLPNTQNFCVRMCREDSECRTGYVCQLLNAQQGLCAPDPNQPIDPSVLEGNPFDIQCLQDTSGEFEIAYEVGQDAHSYMVVPFTPSSRDMSARSITLPSGGTIDLRSGANAFQSVPQQLFGSLNPTVIPAIPQFQQQIQSGSHTMRVVAEAPDLCWYKHEKSVAGNAIDLNVYVVGLTNLNAQTAATDPNFAEVMAEVNALYRQSGIALRDVRFYDVSAEAAARFAIIRDEDGLRQLLKESQRPGDQLEDVLSVNVFFVRGLRLGGAIGVSLGLPGPAGLHGMVYSGVVFTAQFMGTDTRDGFNQPIDGNFFTAQVLAHEVGHYLGLFHTSEQNGRSFDPLLDTPTCNQISINCPDVTNLMFPYASALNTEISPDQAFVLKANPLIQFDETIEFPDPDPDPDMGGDMGDMGLGDMGLSDMGLSDMGGDMDELDMGGEQ